MRFIGSFIKYQLIFVFYLFLLNYQPVTAQESKSNKIIIDETFGNGRLLSPPTEGREKKIKLIPPKSVLEKDKKKFDKIREVKEDKDKKIKSNKDAEVKKKKKELEAKRKSEEQRERKKLETLKKIEDEQRIKAEEKRKQEELKAKQKAEEEKKQKELEAKRIA